MYIKINTKILFHCGIFFSSFFLLVISSVFASTSADFDLDFDTVTTGAQQYESSDFYIHAGITPIETGSLSSDFTVETINLIPEISVCGNGIIEDGEMCDGTEFGGQSCINLGFSEGNLTCVECTTMSTTSCANEGGGGGSNHHVRCTLAGTCDDEEQGQEEKQIEESPETSEPSETSQESDLSFGGGMNVYINDFYIPDATFPKREEEYPLSFIQEALHPSPLESIDLEKYELHLTHHYRGQVIYAIDRTPFVGGKLEPHTEYVIDVYDGRQNHLVEQNIYTNNDGIFSYEHSEDLEDGEYSFVISKEVISQLHEHEKQHIRTYSFVIRWEQYDAFQIISFAEHQDVTTDFEADVDLGKMRKQRNQKIVGEGIPFAFIFAYFESSELFLQEVQADNEGRFEIDIPSELSPGRHKAHIIQILPEDLSEFREFIHAGEKVSGILLPKDATYFFELTPQKTCFLWLVFLGFPLFLFWKREQREEEN